LGHHVLQVAHLHPLFLQRFRKQVMLALRAAEVGDIIKEHPAQVGRGQLLKLGAGTMEQDFLQRPGFTVHSYRHAYPPLIFMCTTLPLLYRYV